MEDFLAVAVAVAAATRSTRYTTYSIGSILFPPPGAARSRAGKMSQDFVGRPRAGRERCSVERELTENKSERELEEPVKSKNDVKLDENVVRLRENCTSTRAGVAENEG